MREIGVRALRPCLRPYALCMEGDCCILISLNGMTPLFQLLLSSDAQPNTCNQAGHIEMGSK